MASPDPNFEICVNRLLGKEGGYVFNPNDPGGETNWGITSRIAAKWGFRGEMKYMARETAVEIYQNEYWLSPRINELAFPLSFQVFDGGVNHGPGQSIKWLQKAIGVEDDGIIGNETLTVANSFLPLYVGIDYILQRGKFYISLPTWGSFGRGWTDKRILDNLATLKKDCL